MNINQKRVTFHNLVKRRYIERTPSEDRANLWYSASDYSAARERESAIRSRIQQCNYSEQAANFLVSEGIFTLEEMTIKNIIVESAISAVLVEQERQEAEHAIDQNGYESFVLDEQELAQEYLVHSRVSLARAQNRARRLAQHESDSESHTDEELSTLRPKQESSYQRRARSRSPKPSKSKMDLVRRRANYGRSPLRREDAPQVVKCTTPAA